MFAAATGLRPGEWIALERRDIDPAARVVYVRRAYRNGRLKCTKTEGSVRAVPLQEIALDAIARLPTRADTDLLFPSPRGTYFDLHNFRTREWKPAQLAVGITPLRRVYDLRHTFATFALRAGISTFDLSRYMGASLTMIDRPYAHLARDGRDHAINLLDAYSRPGEAGVHQVDVAWTLQQRAVATSANRRRLSQEKSRSPLTDSNRRPPPYQGGPGGHGRAPAVMFLLQNEPSIRVCHARECPRVPELMYPSCTRDVLSVFQTNNSQRRANPH